MTQNNFKIAFEILATDRARVYLNDKSVGHVRIHDVITKGKRLPRLTYRNSSSPFKNLIPTDQWTDLANETVESLLKRSDVYRHVCAAVIRGALYYHDITELPLHKAA
jgi:hypothetical protein